MRKIASRLALLALSLAAAQSPLHAGELFSIGNDNPLLRGIYLPRTAVSRADDGVALSADFSISNTINVESNPREALFVDGESDTLRLTLDAPLARAWRWRLSVPVIRDSSGFLDSTIDSWHRFFGLPRGDRPNYPKSRLQYSYVGFGRAELDSSQTHLGDLAGEVGWYAFEDADRTVALWGGLEAPTGSASKLTGDGAWDGAVWIHAAQRHARWQFGADLGLVRPFGDDVFEGAARRLSGFARAAVSWQVNHAVALRIQLDGQTARIDHTQLRFLGPSLQGSLGAEIAVGKAWGVQLGFIEDAAVDTAPDVGFFLGLRRALVSR